MRLGHSVPRADQTTAVFSPRNSEYLGREQPVSEQTVVRARVSPGSRLGCSWPSWYAGWYAGQRHTLGLEDQSKPIYRTVSHVIVGMGAGAWGQRDGVIHSSQSHPTPGLSLHPPAYIMSPGATPHHPN